MRELLDFLAPQIETEQRVDDGFATDARRGGEASPRMEQR
jgi:hypothetical protein